MIAKQKENLILDQDSLKPRAFLFVPLWAERGMDEAWPGKPKFPLLYFRKASTTQHKFV